MIGELFTRIKRLVGHINIRLSIPPRQYEFSPVSRWLNQLVSDHDTYSLLFDGSNTWIVLKKNNIKIKYLDRLNSISSIILTIGNFEETELDLVESNLREGSVFFDIGANVGLYSITMAKKFEDIKIYAFEPVPDTIREFKDNIDKNEVPFGKICLIEAAVSDRDGHVDITTDFHSSNYLTRSDSTVNHIEVGSVTIDNFVQKNDIRRISLIKIDVEGNEYLVLKGAMESIKKFRPVIVIELIEKDLEFSENKYEDPNKSINILLNLDYKYYILDDNSNLLHMDNKDKGCFNIPFHNYIFYHGNINTHVTQNIQIKREPSISRKIRGLFYHIRKTMSI